MNYEKWIKLNTKDLLGKTAVITGSTGGLGNEISKTLAMLNCNLILLNRNIQKSEKQKIKLLTINPKISIEIIELDLCDFTQVKNVTNVLKEKQFDYFIHNAGIYNVPIYETETGYNNVFQTNFISPYFITKELMSNIISNNAKVIVVSSIAHNYSKLNEKDIDFSNSKKHSKIYGNSKRFLTFSMFELLKNHPLNLSICHPGITLTNMTNHYPKFINWFVKFGIKILFPNTKQASLNIIKSLFEHCNYFEWMTPKIFNVWGLPIKKKVKTVTTVESEKIYNIAESIYKKLRTE